MIVYSRKIKGESNKILKNIEEQTYLIRINKTNCQQSIKILR